MKNKFTNSYSRIVTVAAFSFMLLFSACSKKLEFASSSLVPSARGEVKVKQDKNKNYQISVDVKHLAEPNRLSTPKSHYIVWIQTAGNHMENLGQLRINKALHASLTAVSSFQPIRVLITAEDQTDVREPGMYEVLSTSSFN